MPATKKREIKLRGPLFRDARIVPVARAADAPVEEPFEFDIVMSTETPVRMYDWWTGDYFYEVLGHRDGEVDLSYMDKGGAFLEEHRGKPVGVVRNARLDDAELKGRVRTSRNPAGLEVARDVQDQIRDKISIGYEVRKYAPMGVHKDGLAIMRAVDWSCYEASLVGIPADLNASVREKAEEQELLVAIEGEQPAKEGRTMKKVRSDAGALVEVDDSDPRPAVTEERTKTAVEVVEREADDRIRNVRALCEANSMPEFFTDLLARHGESVTLKQAADAVMEQRKTKGSGQPAAEALGLDADVVKSYSVTRALRSMIEASKGIAPKTDEWEISERLRKLLPETYAAKSNSIMIPTRAHRPTAERTLGSKVSTGGAELVMQEQGGFIDILRVRPRVVEFGAQVLTGLTGPITFPKQTQEVTGYWVAENPAADVTGSEPKFGTIVMTPRTMQASTIIPRQLIMQESIDAEGIVRDSMGFTHKKMFDKAALYGLGVQGQPRGIMNTDDVLTVAMGGVPTWAKLVEMPSKVVDAEADLDVQRFMTTALMAGKLLTTPKIGTTFPNFIWEGGLRDGSIAGYSAGTSGQVSKVQSTLAETGGAEHGIFFGSWNQLVLGLWGVMEIIFDEVTLKKKGQIELTSFQMGDVILRYPEAFCVATGATLS